MKKICPNCKKEFEYEKKYYRIYCTTEYAHEAYRLKMGFTGTFDLPAGTVGALAELTVAIDLLQKGYEVYRSLSPSCSGDLLIEKNKEFLKIEVRTGYRHSVTKHINTSYQNIHSSILAVVIFKESLIIYLEYPSRKEIKL